LLILMMKMIKRKTKKTTMMTLKRTLLVFPNQPRRNPQKMINLRRTVSIKKRRMIRRTQRLVRPVPRDPKTASTWMRRRC